MKFLFFLFACRSESGATVVGNPGSTAMSQLAPTEEFQYRNASMFLNYISYTSLDPASDTEVEIAQVIDLLDSDSTFPIVEGSWKAIDFHFSSCYSNTCPSNWSTGEYQIFIEGLDPQEEEFQLNLYIDKISFSYADSYETKGSYILELASPEWLADQDLTDTDALSELIRLSSTLNSDIDEDGVLDDSER